MQLWVKSAAFTDFDIKPCSVRLLLEHWYWTKLFEQSAEVNHHIQHSRTANGKQRHNLSWVCLFLHTLLSSPKNSPSLHAVGEIANMTLMPCSPLAPFEPRLSLLFCSFHIFLHSPYLSPCFDSFSDWLFCLSLSAYLHFSLWMYELDSDCKCCSLCGAEQFPKHLYQI